MPHGIVRSGQMLQDDFLVDFGYTKILVLNLPQKKVILTYTHWLGISYCFPLEYLNRQVTYKILM